ncbi:MAG: ATP-binding protein [Thermotogota bacterium]|nr:ATP-binding protein [Thermotogota bacterium]
MRQILFNIIDNAIKYTEKGSIRTDIKILNDKKPKTMIIKIKDTGLGFTQQDKEKIFELFIRGTAGKNTYIQGTGMGLHLAKKFAEMHNGQIFAYSAGKNKGSAFCVELPIIENPKNEVEDKKK